MEYLSSGKNFPKNRWIIGRGELSGNLIGKNDKYPLRYSFETTVASRYISENKSDI